MEAITCCCGWEHFAIGNGVETEKGAVCTSGSTVLAHAILAFFLWCAQPRLLKPNAARSAIYPIGMGQAIEYGGAVLTDLVLLDDELDLQ
jgi:hypothetical protein